MPPKELKMNIKKYFDDGVMIDVVSVEDVCQEMESMRNEFKMKSDAIKKEILENFDLIAEEVYWNKKVQTNTIQEDKFIEMVNKAFLKNFDEEEE